MSLNLKMGHLKEKTGVKWRKQRKTGIYEDRYKVLLPTKTHYLQTPILTMELSCRGRQHLHNRAKHMSGLRVREAEGRNAAGARGEPAYQL